MVEVLEVDETLELSVPFEGGKYQLELKGSELRITLTGEKLESLIVMPYSGNVVILDMKKRRHRWDYKDNIGGHCRPVRDGQQ